VHRVGVSAPDITGADESNPPASESFRSTGPNLNLRVAKNGGLVPRLADEFEPQHPAAAPDHFADLSLLISLNQCKFEASWYNG
jgi:hypothetical protein